ncbi:MAG: serralysin, partial [Actinomycetota bacterium]|nr:serralysin [Actinomycetota bacterium]
EVAVAIAADGVVTMVYKGGCGPCGMRVRQRAVGGTWSPAVELEDFDPLGELEGNQYKDVSAPAVASGPGGRVTATWSVGAQNVRQQVIRTSTLEDGSWSPAQTISGDLHPDDDARIVFEHRYASQIAFDATGRTLVLWTHSFEDTGARDDWSKNMVHFETAARAADATAFVDGAEIARRTATEFVAEVQLGMAEDGVATFVWNSWQSPDFDGTSVHARRRAATGELGAVTPVVSAGGTSFDHLNPKLAVTPGGEATVLWTRSALFPTTAVADDVLTRTWSADNSWEQPDVVGTGLTTEAVDVAAGRDRTVAVSWQRFRGTRSEVRGYARLRRPDGTWADTVTLAGPDAQRSLDPFVAVEGDGDALAIWRSQSFNDSTSTQTDFVETMATGSPPPDTQGPQITIATPAIGQRFTQNAQVTADFACTDDVHLQQCQGTVADGASLDTGTIGQHAFTVVATDGAGHETTRTHGYFVDAPASNEPPIVGDPFPGSAPVISQPPPEYREIRPLTPAQIALRNSAAPAVGAVKAAPKVVKASTLLNGKLVLTVKPTIPNIDVRGAFTLKPTRLISDNGLGLISDNGLGIIGPAAANIIGTACCNLIGAGSGNIISQNHANLTARTSANVGARSAASVKLTVLAKATKSFTAPKAGKLRLKVNRKGRAALRRAFRKRGKQTITILYMVGFTERGSTNPTVVTARQIKLRE